MPYTSTPPSSCRASNTCTWCPIWMRSPAHARLAGPLPISPTFLPVAGADTGDPNCPVSRSQSAPKRSRAATPTHSALFARGWRGHGRSELSRLALPIGHEALQVSNSNRLALLAQHTTGLALVLDGTDPSGNRWQCVVFANLRCRPEIITREYEVDHRSHVHRDRALVDAAGLGTLNAAQRFLSCLLGGKTEVHFAEIVGPHLGVLLGHALTRQLDAFLVGQRIIAGDLVSHGSPRPAPMRRRALDCSHEASSAPLPDRPASARCWHAPALDTCCCAASIPQS